MALPRLRIRLTGRQVINWSLISCVAELAILIALMPGRDGGAVPSATWAVAMVVPGVDVLLGLRLWQVMRRFALARFPLFTGVLLALLGAWTVWGWE